jgi:hypothetical protein
MKGHLCIKKSPAFRRIRGVVRQGLRKVVNLELVLYRHQLDTHDQNLSHHSSMKSSVKIIMPSCSKLVNEKVL